MDAEDEVFREVREVLWRTASEKDRARCRVPKGCEEVERWVDDRREKNGEEEEEEEEEEETTNNAGDNDEEDEGESSEDTALLSSDSLSSV